MSGSSKSGSGGGVTLPPLVQQIIGDVSGLTTAYATAGKMAKKFGTSLSAPMKEAQVAANRFGSAIKGFVAPLVAAGTAWASFSAVMNAFERAETLNKTADGLGVTVDALDKLNYAATLSSSSAGELSAAMLKMNMMLGAAAEGSTEAQDTLLKMGMTIKDFSGLSADEAFLKIADGLNGIGSQGEKARVGMAIFGRGAKNIATLAGQGSDAIKALGKEGESMGRTLSSIDVAKLMEAKDSIEKMQTAFTSLADRVAIAFAPLFSWVTEQINAWIGDTRSFDSTFNTMAKAVVVAIGTIKMVWQGLQLLWEGAKVVIYDLGAGFADAAKVIVKAAMWISHVAQGAWTELKLSFAASMDAIVLGWKYIKVAAIEAFSYIGVKFGETIRAMGEAAASSRIKGLADAGRAAQEAGGEMIVGAVRLKEGVTDELNAAKSSLGASLKALQEAKEQYAKTPIDAETPYLDAVSAGYVKLRNESIQAMRSISQDILGQEGGNAIAAALAGYGKMYSKFQSDATKKAEEGSKARAVITFDEFKKYSEYLRGAEERHRDYVFNLWKRTVDAAEKINDVVKNQAMLNKALMAEQDAAHAEFTATREAREHAAMISIHERRMKAEEELSSMQVNAEAERQARISEQRLAYAKQDEDQQNTIVAQWESGIRGKAEVMSGFFEQMSVMMESKNKKMFEIGKAAAMAQTAVDTYRGAQAAFTSYAGLGPWGVAAGIAAASAAVIAGLARVNKIKSTTIGGGAGGGGSGGGSSSYSSSGSGSGNGSGASQPQQTVYINVQGQNFGQEQIRGLAASLQNAIGNDNLSFKVA